ncbi:MAG: hypothetical protein F6K35_48495, partial [Okeania sp. SIO2H7]|nr:hypothetical protein [Okeania sp. SIO2H7]
ELLTPEWEMMGCSRCEMPVPLRTRGMPPECCPCFDLPNWPDCENPLPRSPVNSQNYLLNICKRIAAKAIEETPSEEESCDRCPLELILQKPEIKAS